MTFEDEPATTFSGCLLGQPLSGTGLYRYQLRNLYNRHGLGIITSILALNIAFRAYEYKIRATQGLEIGILLSANGSKFDNQFFISAAQTHCFNGTIRRGAQFHHDNPGYFLVNHAVMNNPDFHRTFNCKVGSAMRPETRCPEYQTEV